MPPFEQPVLERAVTRSVGRALRNGSVSACDSWSLLLDKLSFLSWKNGVEDKKYDAAKSQSLKQIRDCYRRATLHLQAACDAKLRWLDCLTRQHGDCMRIVRLVNDSRVLVHLGRASVLENVGLCADRTTGLPVIPGTALKGVLSTWACWEANQKPDGSFNEGVAFVQQRKQFSKDLAQRVFGDDSKDGSEHAGDVIFIGGFPTTSPKLGLDIVNPHYEPDGRDKTNLTPNVFLCVEPDTKWQFAFYVRPGAPDAVKLCETTVAWLTQALTQLGIGAKTAAGYGRFRQFNDADLAAQAKEAEIAKADEAATAEQANVAADKARLQDALKSDYPNDATFKSRVLDKLNPGQMTQLLTEVSILQKPENEARREQLRKLLASRDYKDIRKRLRDKDWFPKEWLPLPP